MCTDTGFPPLLACAGADDGEEDDGPLLLQPASVGLLDQA